MSTAIKDVESGAEDTTEMAGGMSDLKPLPDIDPDRLNDESAVAQSLKRLSGWGTKVKVTIGTPEGDEQTIERDVPDPDRILADIESKRRIVALHSDPRGGDPSCSSLDYPESAEDCATLHALAAPFSGEPGYDAERWAV